MSLSLCWAHPGGWTWPSGRKHRTRIQRELLDYSNRLERVSNGGRASERIGRFGV